MESLKILVVDDTQTNIEVAKVASKEFPQHEFTFMTSAIEAFNQIQNFDAVITDLFFPEEPSKEMMIIWEQILSVYSEDNMFVKRLIEVESYLTRDITLGERLARNLSYVKDGSKHGFPLGLALMIKAKNHKNCLISSIGGSHNNHGGVDAVIVLLPLVDKGILAVKTDYDICRYNGVNFISGNSDKQEPETWEKAIHCILAQ